MGKQANQYDKIFRENLEAVIPGLIQNLLGIRAVWTEELPDDLQHTKERKPDVLKKIVDEQDRTFVLQIEFQLMDEPAMVFRMAEYYIMLARKYRLPVQQYVFFLGTGMPRMAVQYQSDWMQYRFRLVAFHTLDYRIFLNSDRPEEVLLSVLGDFKEEKLETVLEEIVERVKKTTEGDFRLKRYYNQLRILAQLRNLEEKLKELTMDDLANFVSVERDALYMVGKEITEVKFITNLLKLNQFTVEEIAALGDVSVELVEKVKAKLAAGPSPAGGE